MKKENGVSQYIFVILGLIVVGIIGMFIVNYNTIVAKEEQVKSAWSQVESNLQRKLDLLPNLVKTIKAYAKHEKELLTQIAELRSQTKKALDNKDSKKLAKLNYS
jgi:LemA protein